MELLLKALDEIEDFLVLLLHVYRRYLGPEPTHTQPVRRPGPVIGMEVAPHKVTHR